MSEWVMDEAARARVDAELARIEKKHQELPLCPCGARTANPSGVCGRRTPAHDALVAEARWRR
jgi:hypothetical protein